MELERKEIQRRDFPTARRGYDPDEVNAHLAEIADAVEEIRTSSTAGSAAQRVQAIVEAAERSATEIETAARQEAEQRKEKAAELLTAAEGQVEASRQRIDQDVAESLNSAGEAERLLDEAGKELERLRGALGKLRGTLESPYDVSVPEEEPEPAAKQAEQGGGTEAQPPADAKAEGNKRPDSKAPAREQAEPAAAHAEPPEADAAVEEAQETPAEAAHDASPATGSRGKRGAAPRDGAEGARLIALNMALTGTPREETRRYLAENFELDDVEGLVSEVYSG